MDYQNLIDSSNRRVVAIGETGLDYFHLWQALEKYNKSLEEVKAKQEEVFRIQIKLAKKNNLALVVHGRNGKEDKTAYQDIYKILKDEKADKGVIHCYGGNLAEAKRFVDLGFYIGFTGIVTFKNAQELQDIAKWVPLDKILIETDAPYLTPEPYRGKRNEPAYVKYVAEKIAELRAMSAEQAIELTGNNAIKLFNLN